MCKKMLVTPVNRVVDKKIIIGKMEGQGGGEPQGVADQKNSLSSFNIVSTSSRYHSLLLSPSKFQALRYSGFFSIQMCAKCHSTVGIF
jgi:hypothetical protein